MDRYQSTKLIVKFFNIFFHANLILPLFRIFSIHSNDLFLSFIWWCGFLFTKTGHVMVWFASYWGHVHTQTLSRSSIVKLKAVDHAEFLITWLSRHVRIAFQNTIKMKNWFSIEMSWAFDKRTLIEHDAMYNVYV